MQDIKMIDDKTYLKKVLKFGSAHITGGWAPIAFELASYLSRYGYLMQVRVTDVPPDADNCRLVSNGSLDASICISPVTKWAYEGKQPFEHEMKNLRAVATLPRTDWMNFPVAEKTAIKSFKDIRDKKYPLRVAGPDLKRHIGGYAQVHVIEEYGFSFADIEKWGGKSFHQRYGPGPGIDLMTFMRQNKIEAYWMHAPRGANWVKLAIAGFRFLSIDEEVLSSLRKKYGYLGCTVHAGTYPGQDYDFNTIWFPGYTILTNAEQPEDFVEVLTKVIVENAGRLGTFVGGLEGRPGVGLANGWGIPLHSGAEKYYRSLGWYDVGPSNTELY